MTRADIEVMLTNLAETTRYLQETGRLTKAAAEHISEATDQIVTMSAHMSEVVKRIDAAITAGLTHLHGDEEAK